VTIEIEAGLIAGLLLMLAAVFRILTLFHVWPRTKGLILAARLGAAIALAVVVVSAATANAGWFFLDLRSVALGLALMTLLEHLVFLWLAGIDGSGPVSDLAVAALTLLGVLVIPSEELPLVCVQCLVFHHVKWLLFLLGAGGIMLSGSSGLVLGLGAVLAGRGLEWQIPSHDRLCDFLRQATLLALVTLGTGLLVVVLWSWQVLGSFTSGDPRDAGFTVTWLLAALSWSAWWLERRADRWAAVLALIAAFVVVSGLYVASALQAMPGI
jgi:hypothetical protein